MDTIESDRREQRSIQSIEVGFRLIRVLEQAGAKLPLNARRYLERVKELIGAPIDMVSTGPDRDHTILLRHPYHG